MRFWKMVPVFALVLGLVACAEQGAEEGEDELTPADTAMTTPPPAPETTEPMMDDTVALDEGDTLIMDGDTDSEM